MKAARPLLPAGGVWSGRETSLSQAEKIWLCRSYNLFTGFCVWAADQVQVIRRFNRRESADNLNLLCSPQVKAGKQVVRPRVGGV